MGKVNDKLFTLLEKRLEKMGGRSDLDLSLDDKTIKSWIAKPETYPRGSRDKVVFLWGSTRSPMGNDQVAYLIWINGWVCADWVLIRARIFREYPHPSASEISELTVKTKKEMSKMGKKNSVKSFSAELRSINEEAKKKLAHEAALEERRRTKEMHNEIHLYLADLTEERLKEVMREAASRDESEVYVTTCAYYDRDRGCYSRHNLGAAYYKAIYKELGKRQERFSKTFGLPITLFLAGDSNAVWAKWHV